MQQRSKKLWRSALSALLACCLLLGTCSTALAATVSDDNGDDVLHYVSIGASQTNGYGLRGYLPDAVVADPYAADKTTLNVYGYQRAPENAYPAMVTDALSELTGKEVELDQLAISSMRVEELRVLLDNDYYGDAYTRWRFTGGSYNWFNNALEGGLDALRVEYQNAIAEADVISVDIGVNNFGVYTFNNLIDRVMGGNFKWTPEFDAILTPDNEQLYYDIKAEIFAIVTENTDALDEETLALLDDVADIFAYALLGFMTNFDISMSKIYELNPDATVVVLSLQNLMYGVELEIDGLDATLPLGEIYGMVVKTANLYTAVGSPYANRYLYASAGEDGHVTTFLDEILAYNGDPSTLTDYMKDCFDMYDDDMYIRSKIQYGVVAPYLGLDLSDMATASAQLAQFLAAGEAGLLTGDAAVLYATYVKALNTGYDIAAEIMKAAAEKNVLRIDFNDFIANYSSSQDALMSYIMDSVTAGITAVFNGQEYEFVMDENLLSDPTVAAVATLGVRVQLGNSFYAHPNAQGHDEVKTAIMDTLEQGLTGKDYALDELRGATEDMLALLESIYNYADENGYIDAAIAEMELYVEQLEKSLDEIRPEVEAKIAQLEAELAALQAELENAAQELKAEIEAKIAEVEAEIARIEAKLAQIEKSIKEAVAIIEIAYDYATNPEKLVELLKTELENKVAQLKAQLEELKAEIEAEVTSVINAAIAEITAKTEALIAEIEQTVSERYLNATTAEYTVCAQSYYVALGDGSVLGDNSYAAKLADELGLNNDQVALLGQNGLRADTLLATIDSYEGELAKADLVTIGFSNNGITSYVADQLFGCLLGAGAQEIDWASYVGEENVVYIEKALDEIRSYLASEGLEGTIPDTNIAYADVLSLAIESYAYAYAGYLCSYPELVNAIHAINPNAQVILVGTYNPYEALTLDMDGVDVAIGDYVQYLVDAANAHTFGYAMLTGDAVYVDAPAVETAAEADAEATSEMNIVAFLMSYMLNNGAEFYAGENGHEYVKDQILNALNVTVEEITYAKGDVDMDGDINMMDATMLYQYIGGYVALSDDQLAQADINGDGIVNMMDALMLYQYASGNLASF